MKMARLETALRTVIDFNKAFNDHDVPAMMLLLSDDCVFENPDPAAEAASYIGKEKLARFMSRFLTDNPQAHMEIEEIFGFSIHCVMRWRFNYADNSGSGRWFQGVDLFLIKNGLICERKTYLKK